MMSTFHQKELITMRYERLFSDEQDRLKEEFYEDIKGDLYRQLLESGYNLDSTDMLPMINVSYTISLHRTPELSERFIEHFDIGENDDMNYYLYNVRTLVEFIRRFYINQLECIVDYSQTESTQSFNDRFPTVDDVSSAVESYYDENEIKSYIKQNDSELHKRLYEQAREEGFDEETLNNVDELNYDIVDINISRNKVVTDIKENVDQDYDTTLSEVMNKSYYDLLFKHMTYNIQITDDIQDYDETTASQSNIPYEDFIEQASRNFVIILEEEIEVLEELVLDDKQFVIDSVRQEGFEVENENDLDNLNYEIQYSYNYPTDEMADMMYQEVGDELVRLTKNDCYNYLLNHLNLLNLSISINDLPQDFNDQYGSFGYVAYTLESYYDEAAIVDEIKAHPEEIEDQLRDIAAEEGINYHDIKPSDYEIDNLKLTTTIDDLANQVIEEMRNGTTTLSHYINVEFYNDLIKNVTFDIRLL